MDTNFPTVIDPKDLASALAGSQVQETQGMAGFSFLKMDFDTGEWYLGQDSDCVTDEEIIIATPTLQHGWILWSGGRPKKILVSFTQPLPIQPESITLPNGDVDEASEARSFQAGMADDGEMLAFDTNSYGGRKGTDVLLGKIKAHSAEGSKFLYPKVKLTSESYAGKGKRSGKTNYNPVFEIVAWCDEHANEEGEPAEQIEAPAEPETEKAEVEAPKKRQRRKTKSAA
jgi:hypothetical protein